MAGPDASANRSRPDETSEAADDDDGRSVDASGSRSVIVPLRVYKTITVFSTLFAIVGVVGGFVLLDAATNRAQAPVEEIDPLVAGAGLALIVAGAVVYAFSTRFRAEGMGNAKERSDEG